LSLLDRNGTREKGDCGASAQGLKEAERKKEAGAAATLMIRSVRREQDSTIVVEVTRAESVRGDAKTVSAALVEDGIVSDVKAGENLGRKLHHERLVRELVMCLRMPGRRRA